MNTATADPRTWEYAECPACVERGRRIKLVRLAPGARLDRESGASAAEVKCKDCKTPYYVHPAAAVRK